MISPPHPSATASRRSFCWCFRGKAGGYWRAEMAGPLSANMGLAMAPRLSTSSRSDCFRPDLSASAMPSQKAPVYGHERGRVVGKTTPKHWACKLKTGIR